MTSRHALVRRPGPHLAEGLVSYVDRRPVDAALALRQWEGYVRALRDHGWVTTEVAPADDCPDAVFVEDTMAVFRNVALLARSGADDRRPELPGAREAAEALGCSLNAVRAPGTLDGGDVLTVGDTVYVGRGCRTNAEGVRQLRAAFEPLGAQVVPVPISRALHLTSAVSALPDGTVIGYPPLVEDPSVFPHFRPVLEESGAHVVLLGDDALLLAASAPRTAQLFARLGYRPVPVDISEFEKREGCVACLSVRLRELAA
ncbi:dimethylargininase [Streptomyces sp. NPDC056149]|uniref:dimethylargininase n=1 Tax=unclassified Streptomyces TaxID=2593676 RepID=UPI0023814455|nr:dimethylargininase [Streptomyces sp. WZ-12]